MLILSQTLLFIILECESGAALTRPWLPKAMAGSCIFSIAVYLRFQAFYGAFLAVCRAAWESTRKRWTASRETRCPGS